MSVVPYPLATLAPISAPKIVARRRRFLPHNENFDGFSTFWLSTFISLLSSLSSIFSLLLESTTTIITIITMSTSISAAPLIHNNARNHRDWLDTTKALPDKSGRTAGFEYAIQPDGTCMAERQWRERRQRPYTFLQKQKQQQGGSSRGAGRYQTATPVVSSMAQIEQSIKNSSNSSSNTSRMMPPLPKSSKATAAPPAPDFLSPNRRIRNHHNAIFGQHLPNALNSPACARKVFGNQASLQEEQELCQSILFKEKENMPAAVVEEHNNHVEHNDNDDDDLFMDFDVDKMVAERHAAQQQKTQPKFDYGGDDNRRVSDISLVPSEGAITPRGNASNSNSSFVYHQQQQPVVYDLCDTSNDVSVHAATNRSFDSTNSYAQGGSYNNNQQQQPRDSFGSSGNAGGYQQQQQSSRNTSYNQQPNTSYNQQQNTSFDSASSGVGGYQQQQPASSRNTSNYAQSSYNNQQSNNTSFDSSNSSSGVGGYQQQQPASSRNNTSNYAQSSYDNQQSNNTSFGSSNSFGNNAGSYDQQQQQQVSNRSFDSSSHNNTSSFGNNNESFHTAAASSSFDAPNGGDAAPLCPQHNQPCRLLTAKSAANAGRQFYKCSVPDHQDQCDFFEWADGAEGNWNNDDSGGGGGGDYAPAGGDVLDHHNENRRKFGHSSFRPGQQHVIENALKGRDVFVLMPTGGGKSLCYQLPAWCCPGLSVVISPLLSLIQDQVQSMTKLGVQSVFLNSAQDYETEQRDIQRRLFATTAHGGVKLLYITPEKLRHSGVVQNVLKKLSERNHISRFVVDEAHCLRYVFSLFFNIIDRCV
jgi:hypothetical protein